MKKFKAVAVLLIAALIIGGLGYVTAFGVGENKTGSAQGIKRGLDLAGGVSITYQVVGDGKPSKEDMSDTIYKLQQRVENYSTEAQVYQEGEDRINIEIPGVSDANAILEELGNPGTLYFIAQTGADGSENYTYGVDADGNMGYVIAEGKTLDSLKADGSVVVDGTQVAGAQAVTQSSGSGVREKEFVVSLTFTSDGAKAFADATQKAYTNGQSIGIYYDGKFVSVPTVQAVITDGSAVITGMESFDAASKLASTIRIGGLNVELEELRSNVVGAQLGSTAIQTSLKAALVGFIIIAVFMIAVYWLPGFASVLALIIYVILDLLLLLGFNVTLTLPGIAGIILSVGMAVDANVIIFARIREEIAAGKTVRASIKAGYEKALSAIIDGNVTTILAAIVLLVKGSGTVKGFAQTLLIGIIVSVITALFVTRFLMDAFYELGLRSEKLYGKAKALKPIKSIENKHIFFAVSIICIVAGFVFMGMNSSKTGQPLNYSLEFMGGTSTNVTFNEDMSIEKLESDVIPHIEEITGDGNVQQSKVADSNEVIFKTRTLTVPEREAFNKMLSDQFQVSENQIQTETISSTISKEMKSDSIIAVIIAVILMLIYIRIRFTDLRFGVSSVLCLCHDVLVVLAFYAAAKISVGNTFIACMLTIVGYSINATIVVFDRIRENMRGTRGELSEIVNKSVTQTLTRSIFTSLTTFIMVAAIYVYGVTSVREFALPLMVGIICGAYSSVCVAGSLWYVFKTKIATKKRK
ncbi:MAG: protein translocase subunit SecD [Lachnospiraceae bacterium]|nr:protein translocase subunit SecD [Lachnospiraceae bacterium]